APAVAIGHLADDDVDLYAVDWNAVAHDVHVFRGGERDPFTTVGQRAGIGPHRVVGVQVGINGEEVRRVFRHDQITAWRDKRGRAIGDKGVGDATLKEPAG